MNENTENKLNLAAPVLWRQILRLNFTHWEKLADFLLLSEDQKQKILPKSSFGLNLPLRLAKKISKGSLNDPILKQFLPMLEETYSSEGFVHDPVGDQLCRREAKLLHKYEGRVLLVTTSACAMHCRYCFRQNFDYDSKNRSFSPEIQQIKQDASIHEVILSGGDPLSLGDAELQVLLRSVAEIPHVRRIRFHTRFPIGIPERIDESFLKLLAGIDRQIFFVIHANHPNELDEEIFSHLNSLKKLGVVLLNQAVLLKGINDDPETLKTLCEMLADRGILPYYLHQLDRVQGAAHFEVNEDKGIELIKAISQKLSGYAVPRYVREISGEPGKTPIT